MTVKQDAEPAHHPTLHPPTTLAGVTCPGLVLLFPHLADVDSCVGGKIHCSNRCQVDILVSAKFTRIPAKKVQQEYRHLQEAMREGVVIQCLGYKGLTCLRVEHSLPGLLECQGCRLLDVDVVWVPVTTDRIEGHDHLRLQLADVFDHASCHLVNRVADLGTRMQVIC